MELKLNPHLKNLTKKFLSPLLQENACQNLDVEPQLQSWWFNNSQIPDSTDWGKLINFNLNLEAQERTTLPVNGKLRIQENKLTLQLFMKFIRIRTINEKIKDIESNYADNYHRVYNKEQEESAMIIIEATTTKENYQEEY